MGNDSANMNSTLYIERHLTCGDKTYTEMELLAVSRYIVILAEPGGGKTELMKSLGRKLGLAPTNASVFAYAGTEDKKIPLLIDAIDEVATIDQSGINKLLANVRKADPTMVILSSRSSEWGHSSTSAFEQFIGSPPLLVRLNEFVQEEQNAIFNNHATGQDFADFQKEISRFSLEMLLPNPQFLTMFADAYLESNKKFSDKRSIFALAVERLAKEANKSVPKKNSTLSIAKKISLSSEVFTKLLLCGAEGVNTTEATESRIFPMLSSLFSGDTAYYDILSTRLFKLGDYEDQHRPVHKIVAEYCAADYLVKRIADNNDPLSIAKCLPIIAPNNTPRDELRGLIGWIAALGSKSIQEEIIQIDAYAVLANGDPSQLESSSKRLLLNKLKEIEARDPYFRRGDFWRRFSVAGFFTQDVLEEIKPLIKNGIDGHLRGLIFELIIDSPNIDILAPEFNQVITDPKESESIRILATQCLIKNHNYNFFGLLQVLIFEATSTSLNLAARIIGVVGPDKLSPKFISSFLIICTKLYPRGGNIYERVVGSRYFIKNLISHFSLSLIEFLLDELTSNLICECGKQDYECNCRNGVSKIVGSMLDRYFELAKPPYSPARVWEWVSNLNFNQQIRAEQSKAVEMLQTNEILRQAIILHVFGPMKDRDKIFNIKTHKFQSGLHAHSGLQLWKDDYRFIIEQAFELNNIELWRSFIPSHQRYRKKEEQGVDAIRRLARMHANANPLFMKAWAHFNKSIKTLEQEYSHKGLRTSRLIKRREKKERSIRQENMTYINSNRELIENGRHWGYLLRFSEFMLHEPKRIKMEFGDDVLVNNALKNCLEFISPHVPDLNELANLQCESKFSQSEVILYAACLVIFRDNLSLDGVPPKLLAALRTGFNVAFDSISNEENETLKKEVDRIIFSDGEYPELFMRQYVEPQLARKCAHPEVWLLANDPIFSNLRGKLSVEWLNNYPNVSLNSLDTLFEIAVKFGDRESLKGVIAKHCIAYLTEQTEQTEQTERTERTDILVDEDFERKKMFWLIREFYFFDDIHDAFWNILKSSKDNVLYFHEVSGGIHHSDRNSWPKLKSNKIEAILYAFFDQWSPVELPNTWSDDSPKEQKAYRFLSDLIWSINLDDSQESLVILSRLLADSSFSVLKRELQSIHAIQVRKLALQHFEPPTPQDIVNQLDHGAIVTVEGLRQTVLQELNDFQKAIHGGEFNSADRFYQKGERLDENSSTEIIAERLSLRLEPQSISITTEHQLKGHNRSDFTATKLINNRRCLLVIEVKGQWHRELYTAASAQLYDRYSIHPDAEQQGIFLVIWFGKNESVAGKKSHGINSAEELKVHIENTLPMQLKKFIDVFVLDVSRE